MAAGADGIWSAIPSTANWAQFAERLAFPREDDVLTVTKPGRLARSGKYKGHPVSIDAAADQTAEGRVGSRGDREGSRDCKAQGFLLGNVINFRGSVFDRGGRRSSPAALFLYGPAAYQALATRAGTTMGFVSSA